MKRITAALILTLLCVIGVASAEEPLNQTAILDIRNCEELANLKDAEYPFDDVMEAFASKYGGQTVSIDGFIYDADFGSWRDIEIQMGDFEEATGTGPSFVLKDVRPEDFGVEGSAFPDFIEYGNNVRVVGQIEAYDDFDSCITLALVSIESRNPLLEGLDAGAYVTLEKGAKGDDVKALQQRLIDLYYLDGEADGAFGKNTKAAVEKFQKAIKIDVTGIADPTTQAVLFSDQAPEATLSISCSSIVVGSSAKTVWYVDGQEFTLQGSKTKTVETRWGTYKFDAYGNYEKVE